MMLAVIRLRGNMKIKKEMNDNLQILGLRRVNTVVLVENKKENVSMIKKVDNFVAWGELNEDIGLDMNAKRLKPPKGGLRSIKLKYPKGDLGYRGDKIAELIKRMMQ